MIDNLDRPILLRSRETTDRATSLRERTNERTNDSTATRRVVRDDEDDDEDDDDGARDDGGERDDATKEWGVEPVDRVATEG